MKTILVLFFFCCAALVQKAAAQSVATDSASSSHAAQPASGAGPVHDTQTRPDNPGPRSAPFAGAPARQARRDSRSFRLPKDMVPKVRAGEITASSDYFKPTASTSSPAQLTDSAYVKDYRYFAYNIGRRQLLHPVGTGLLIASGVIVIVIGVTLIIVAALSHAKFY